MGGIQKYRSAKESQVAKSTMATKEDIWVPHVGGWMFIQLHGRGFIN